MAHLAGRDTATIPSHTTTTSTSADNITVSVSIPAGAAENHEIRITLIPRAHRQFEVQAERVPQYSNEPASEPALAPEIDQLPQISRLDLEDLPRTPARRNTSAREQDLGDQPRTPARRNTPAREQDLRDQPRTPARHSTPARDQNLGGVTHSPAAARTRPSAAAVNRSSATAAGTRSPRPDRALPSRREPIDISDDDDDIPPLVPVYPPQPGQPETPHRDMHDGRKYYVITKGKSIGVFYEHWNAVEHLTMKNQGGSFTNQLTYTAAKNAWLTTPKSQRYVIG